MIDEPEYCDFYKVLLVEEISLCNHPHLQHYGKCAVIGITSLSMCGVYYLNSVKLKSIEKQFQIPSGSTNVILDIFLVGRVPINQACEVFGEVVLLDRIDKDENVLPKTSKDLVRQLRNIKLAESSSVEADWNLSVEEMEKRYLPAIRVHTINIVGQPVELIECNLAIRCLRKNR